MRDKTVLYVEDEQYDVLFMRRAFSKVLPEGRLDVAMDGQKALDYLEDSSHPAPDLVLLDLNLPLISGFDVLAWIRRQQSFASLPVVIFSSSDRPEDRARAEKLGANEYIQKPSSALDFSRVLEKIRARWFAG